MAELPCYYDTTNETARLDEHEEKTAKENDLVLAYIRSHAGQPFTPAEVAEAIDPDEIHPLTNYRRSMTNLTTAGHLIHLKNVKKTGKFGRANTTWMYPEQAVQGKLFND